MSSSLRSPAAEPSPRATPSALTHIARGAPLATTLACVVDALEADHPAIVGAVLLLDETGDRLRVAAGARLPGDLHRALEGTGIDARDRAVEEGAAWQGLRDLAARLGWLACVAVPLRSAADEALGWVVAFSGERPADDVRTALADAAVVATVAVERHAAEARIARAEEARQRMAMAIEGSGTGIWDRNVATGEIDYSAGWKAILGYGPEELTPFIQDSYRRVHPDDLAYVQAAMQDHFDQRTESYAVEHRIRCKDGRYKWISSRGKVVRRDADGRALRMIGTTTDITAMRTLSERLQESVDLITSLTNEIAGLVFQFRLDSQGDARFTYVSDGVRNVYELTPEQVAADASLVDALVHPDDRKAWRASFRASTASLAPWHMDFRVVLPVQGLRWRHVDARPRRLPDGGTLWHGFVTDVTERKRAEAELNEAATTDFLTQLPNRRHFMARMEAELARAKSGRGAPAAVLMCDLDHFKAINDRHGHAVGDLVLKHFANVLRGGLRATDAVGRIGGEEFAVLLAGAGLAGARTFARRLQRLLAEAPLVQGDLTVHVTASVGISVLSAADASADAALTRGDRALYLAKERGRNRAEIVVA